MGFFQILCIVVVVLVALLGLALWSKSHRRARRQVAIRTFVAERDRLAADFLAAARTSGKPRGLSWKQAELSGEPVFAIDRVSSELIGLYTATISFEAVSGGGMEEVEAVGNLRTATAIFSLQGDTWVTEGKAAFNLEPPEVVEKFTDSLAPLPVQACPSGSVG